MRGIAGLGQTTEYGTKYEVRGEIQGPSGRSAQVVSIWMLASDDEAPSFITAYPR